MDLITAADLLHAATQKPPCETITIVLDGVRKGVCIQGLTGKQRDAWEASLVRKTSGGKREVNSRNLRAKLAVQCIVNNAEERVRLYSDDQANAIGDLPATVLGPIFDACQRLSGTSDADLDDLETVSAETDATPSASNASPLN